MTICNCLRGATCQTLRSQKSQTKNVRNLCSLRAHRLAVHRVRPTLQLEAYTNIQSRSHHYTACISTDVHETLAYHDNNRCACQSPTTTTHLAVGGETYQAVVTTYADVMSTRNYPAGSTHAVRHTSTAASGNKEVRGPADRDETSKFALNALRSDQKAWW